MNKSFGLTTFQEVFLLTWIKHLSKRNQTNQNIVQDYHLTKSFDNPSLDYINSF